MITEPKPTGISQIRLPSIPQEVIEFIGGNYCSKRYESKLPAMNLQDIEYTLTVHDLLSAFDNLRDKE